MAEYVHVMVFGAGGHGAVVIEIIESMGTYRVAGVADDDESRYGTDFLGYSIGPVGSFPASLPIVVAIGDNGVRARVASRFAAAGRMPAPPLVHASAAVSRRARLGQGTVVMAGAVVNPRTVVGAHAIINTGAAVDHDCIIGDFAHVSPGARLAGGVQVDTAAHVGAGAIVIPGVEIGARTVVGAGAVVIRNLPDDVVAVGNPARVVRNHRPSHTHR